MNVTPAATPAVPLPAPAEHGAGAGSATTLFSALVAQALATTAPVTPDRTSTPAPPQCEAPVTEPAVADRGTDLITPMITPVPPPGLFAPSVAPAPVAPVAPVAPEASDGWAVDDEAAGASVPSPAGPTRPTDPLTVVLPVHRSAPAAPTPPASQVIGAVATSAPDPAAPGDETSPGPAIATTTEPVAAATPSAAGATAQQTPVTASVGSLPVPTAAGTDPAPASAPVMRQVVPEVTRLVTAGNGTHRVTLQLEPEALGEVRVVLTVRDGAVHVRLSAGDDAQRALAEGAPELRRLLELAGASDTRIVVRDLPTGTAPGATVPSPSTGPGGDGSARPDSGRADGGDRSHDQHAGTRGGPATDGTDDGASPPGRIEQVTDARPTGVDVTV